MNLNAVLVAAFIPLLLCSCGAVQLATSDGDRQEDYAFGMALAPVLLITGDWPDTRANNFETSAHYMELIRTRHEGKMTSERSRETLNAMSQTFQLQTIKNTHDTQLSELLGPPDKTMVRSGRRIYVYSFNSPEGLEERWLVKDGVAD